MVITVVLADDHNLVRQGIKSLLETQTEFRVIGEASDGFVATQLVENLNPDALIVDLMMDGLNGIEVTRNIKKNPVKTQVIVLTVYNNERCVIEALKAGAKAYLLKESGAEELFHAVREAVSGHFYLGPPLSERAIKVYLESTKSPNSDPYDELTPREREVLNLLAQGWTNIKIATRLYISRRTVEIHRANITKKLNLHSQGELMRFAIQKGVLPQGVTSPDTGNLIL
jgi:two-component system, NarL family, response regulator NreC